MAPHMLIQHQFVPKAYQSRRASPILLVQQAYQLAVYFWVVTIRRRVWVYSTWGTYLTILLACRSPFDLGIATQMFKLAAQLFLLRTSSFPAYCDDLPPHIALPQCWLPGAPIATRPAELCMIQIENRRAKSGSDRWKTVDNIGGL